MTVYHPVRNRYILAGDLGWVALSAWLAFRLHTGSFPSFGLDPFRTFVIAAVLTKLPVFLACGLYWRYWLYASVRELALIVAGVTAGTLALAVVGLFWGGGAHVAPEILAIDWLVTLVGVAASRLSVRMVAEFSQSVGAPELQPLRGGTRRVLVVGAGDAGALITREMQRSPQLGLAPVGFLDDDSAKHRKRIHGVRVMGGISDLKAVVVALRVEEVVIALPEAPGSVVRDIIEQCREAGMPARAMPGMLELLDGKVTVSRLRPVEIEDLLRREPVGTSTDGRYLEGQTVLVTGAGGSIGLELCRQVARTKPASLVLLGHGENSLFEAAIELRNLHPLLPLHTVVADLRSCARLDQVFRQHAPDVVLHAAAHKHVTLMEQNPAEAITNNIVGTRNLVDASLGAGVSRFVLISSDKAVSPVSLMGASKRVSEMVVRDAARRHQRAYVAVRFGNVLGSRGSVVQVFKRQIERGGPLTITHPEMTRFFMTIPEAVHLVLHAGGLGRGGELFVLNMGQPVRIVDLAEDLMRLSGVAGGQVPIVFTGIQAGEKLHEALWEDNAEVCPTDNPDVMRVTEPETWSSEELQSRVDALAVAARAGDTGAIRGMLAAVVATCTASTRPHA